MFDQLSISDRFWSGTILHGNDLTTRLSRHDEERISQAGTGSALANPLARLRSGELNKAHNSSQSASSSFRPDAYHYQGAGSGYGTSRRAVPYDSGYVWQQGFHIHLSSSPPEATSPIRVRFGSLACAIWLYCT